MFKKFARMALAFLVFGLIVTFFSEAQVRKPSEGGAKELISTALHFWGADSTQNTFADTIRGVAGTTSGALDTTTAVTAFGAEKISLIIFGGTSDSGKVILGGDDAVGEWIDSIFIDVEFSYDDRVLDSRLSHWVKWTASTRIDTFLWTDSTNIHVTNVWPPGPPISLLDSMAVVNGLTAAGVGEYTLQTPAIRLQKAGIDPTSVPYMRYIFSCGDEVATDTAFVQGRHNVVYDRR
tara:strand:+ start:12436 stop:13143 length:708 start_codon:yes stop_codon:yes gene_type:complete